MMMNMEVESKCPQNKMIHYATSTNLDITAYNDLVFCTQTHNTCLSLVEIG